MTVRKYRRRMADLADVLAVLDLVPTDPDASGAATYTASHLDTGHRVVYGGQLLAQSVIAASQAVPEKELLSLHTVFARGGNFDEPLTITVETLQSGRAFASVSVTTSQSRGVCTRSTALLHAPDADRIRHGDAMPVVGGPDDWQARSHESFWETRIVDDVDVMDPTAPLAPPELRVWCRFPGVAADDIAVNQALLAYASDGFLIATAMRPHDGIDQTMAHVSVSTTVLTQTLTFHEPIVAADWLLLDLRSTYAGRGRSHGGANVFTAAGDLVASFDQDNMIREMPEAMRPKEGEKAKF
jgi:acyl-CoA thioesterase-2